MARQPDDLVTRPLKVTWSRRPRLTWQHTWHHTSCLPPTRRTTGSPSLRGPESYKARVGESAGDPAKLPYRDNRHRETEREREKKKKLERLKETHNTGTERQESLVLVRCGRAALRGARAWRWRNSQRKKLGRGCGCHGTHGRAPKWKRPSAQCL